MSQTTHADLAERFARGEPVESLPAASNMTAATHVTGAAMLVSYGHAVLATRSPSGRVILCEGWRGYTQTTSCQLTKLRDGFTRALGEDGFDVLDTDPSTDDSLAGE